MRAASQYEQQLLLSKWLDDRGGVEQLTQPNDLVLEFWEQG